MLITTWEASEIYNLSTSHLRLLLSKDKIKGRQARVTPNRSVWLIEESSLKKYIKSKPKPGPKPRKKT